MINTHCKTLHRQHPYSINVLPMYVYFSASSSLGGAKMIVSTAKQDDSTQQDLRIELKHPAQDIVLSLENSTKVGKTRAKKSIARHNTAVMDGINCTQSTHRQLQPHQPQVLAKWAAAAQLALLVLQMQQYVFFPLDEGDI